MVGTGIDPFDGRDFGRKPNDLEIYRNGIWGGGSAIDLVVRTDVVQNYLVLGAFQAPDDSVRVGQTDGMLSSESAGKRMKTKLRVVGIAFKLVQDE